VSTEAGGIPAILTHARHGLLAPLADYETMGRHVLRLLGDPAYARGLARAAFATCDGCTWPSVRERWLDVYRDVASARCGSGFKARAVTSADAGRPNATQPPLREAFETTSSHDPA
jgi:hypothetical protein